MTTNYNDSSVSRQPDISLVMPCYNEEAAIGYTIPQLVAAFEKVGCNLQLIAVDNGSWDRTGETIKELAKQNPSVVYHRVEKNEGYGNGILSGISLCSAAWIGTIPADGQVDAEDVVRLYQVAAASNGRVVAKVRRRFRMDGLRRKVVSITYNLFVRTLWPRLGSIDVNGVPKILPRDVLNAMQLKSKGWLLDPEIMIKAYYMGLRVLEFNVFARMRSSGISHVNIATFWEFFWNLLLVRFSGKWRGDLKKAPLQAEKPVG